MCECCGKILVLLKRVDLETGQMRYVACYIKGWDGNPWYVGGSHSVHPPKRYARFKRAQQEARQDPDPFFRLD